MELNVIFPPVDPVFTSSVPVNIVALLKVTASAEVATLPAVWIPPPVKFRLTAPSEFMSPSTPIFRVPAEFNVTVVPPMVLTGEFRLILPPPFVVRLTEDAVELIVASVTEKVAVVIPPAPAVRAIAPLPVMVLFTVKLLGLELTLTAPIFVPIAPFKITAPVDVTVRLLTAPAAVPLTDPKVIAFAIPVPTVRVTPLAKVAFPKVMAPVDVPPTVVVPPTVTEVVPRLITPVTAAVMVPLMALLEGAVAVTPPVKARASAVGNPPSPKVKIPVLLKVVIPAIVLFAPVIEIA